MSIFDNSGTEHCGVRLPGRPPYREPDQEQLCRPQPPGAPGRHPIIDTTDECGQPLPQACVAGTAVDYPTCYLDPAAPPAYQSCVLDGFRRITLNSQCAGFTVEILNLAKVVVPGAIEVICEFRSSLPGQPVATEVPL